MFKDNFFGKSGENLQLVLYGLQNTLIITVFAIIIGIVIGSLMALARVTYMRAERPNWLQKILNAIANIYITVIRGTPVALQLLIIYMAVFNLQGPPILVGSLALGINSGGYVAESIRAGILAVDKGQTEAGLSLGLKNSTIMARIVAPQALKNILPALGNEFIAILKETAILGMASIIDLTFASQQIIALTRDYLFNLVCIGIIYLVIVMIITFLLRLLERRLAKSER
ncbi:MAG TPA: amino acid ABC transporter permease [Firmicutes bacterium]|nr:amino acid ABC transporter permease [Bacillota bacterium]